jgi:hypothetical protein
VKTKKADVKEVENRIVVTKTREGYERRKDWEKIVKFALGCSWTGTASNVL